MVATELDISPMGQTAQRGRPRKANNAFGQWIDKSGKDREETARALGITRPHVDRLCRNARRPDLELAVQIERLTKGEVTVASWLKVPAHTDPDT